MTLCLLWFQKTGGSVKEARLSLWQKFAVAVVVVMAGLSLEQKPATKARFDLMAVDSCT